jgi:nitrate reductase NapD
MNVSSIVVQTLPKFLDKVVQSLKDCEDCDYHLHDDKGRVIITIEGNDVSEELKKLKVVEEIPHIISAQMHMSYSEDELDRHMEVLDNCDAVPKILNDNDAKVKDIIYRGDLKGKDLGEFTKIFNQK